MAALPDFMSNVVFDDQLRDRISELVFSQLAHDADELPQTQIKEQVSSLPRLTEEEVIKLGHKDSVCPICLTSLLALIAEEEFASAMESPAHPGENLGVTRLAKSWQCGHIFCRRDISQWIQDGHPSCPTCRRPFVEGASDSHPQRGPQDLDTPEQLDANLLHQIQLQVSGHQGRFFPEPRNPPRSNRDEYSMYS